MDVELEGSRADCSLSGEPAWGSMSSDMGLPHISPTSAPLVQIRPSHSPLSERWVPMKQVNGVAIYHHSQADEGAGLDGGEYMVSAAVRGPPTDVLDVLMSNSANTTIVGPATMVEVLGCETVKEQKKEILRIVMEAPGWAGWLCAPREMVVERMQKPSEAGVFVVLFSSLGHKEASNCCLLAKKPKALDADVCSFEQTRATDTKLHSLYKDPVQAFVNGGYTISPLHDYSVDSSPESLITCILKPAADLLGWTDAFLDRILMSVTLIRDEVEHSRFLARPFSMLETKDDAVEDIISLSVLRLPVGETATGLICWTPLVELKHWRCRARVRGRSAPRSLMAHLLPADLTRGSGDSSPTSGTLPAAYS
eukprot:gene12258-15404_t